MTEHGGHYANKSDREHQILYTYTYIWAGEGQSHRNRELKGGCQGLGGDGNEKMWVKVSSIGHFQ